VIDAVEHPLERRLARQRNIVLTALLGLAAVAWALVILHATGEQHAMPTGLGLSMGMGAPLFIGMWTVMMAAMMFPASAPMILTFSTMQARKRAAGRPYVPVSLFVASYLSVWAAFGVLAFAVAAGVDWAAERSAWVTTQWPRAAGALLVAAGAYQLSPLKDVCLGKCRTPFDFLLHHWRDGRAGAFIMGLQHGLYCFGCCWLLFVILVPLGVMNLAVMLAVTVVVFAEKVLPRGTGVARVAGVALMAYGAFVIGVPDALPGMVM
jgi:predicted metal-binding membrane protein